ncbi:hypothetical protein ACEWY4_016524 [Coilia grayii]|uniref:Uncharacterized protein n=1 Tax=Coilia grayii TaxID=363190 RepID=A0ABD1JNA9_9TELE
MALASGHWLDKEIRGEPPSPSIIKGKVYLFGGVSSPEAAECLPGVYRFDIVSLAWEKLPVSGVPLRTLNHSSVAVGDNIYVYGGLLDGVPTDDLMMFNTGSLEWQQWEVKGESPLSCAGQTLTSHRDKKHYTLILYGVGNLMMGLFISVIVMKEILSEFGLQGVSNGFAATKVPNVKYELSKSSVSLSYERSELAEPTGHRDFTVIRDEALDMIHKAFAMMDEQFQKLDSEKAELAQAAEALRYEKEAYRVYHQKQEQELQEMLEKHRAQNEAWLRARAEENDKERKELCKLREEAIHRAYCSLGLEHFLAERRGGEGSAIESGLTAPIKRRLLGETEETRGEICSFACCNFTLKRVLGAAPRTLLAVPHTAVCKRGGAAVVALLPKKPPVPHRKS